MPLKLLTTRACGLLICLALGLATACSKTPDDAVVLYLRMGSPVEQGIWHEAVTAIEEKYPDIKIKVLNVPYEAYWTKFFTLTASGNPPDIVLMESGFYPGFVKKNALMDLTDRVNASELISLDAYHHTPLEWLQIDERLYGLPCDTAVIIPFFNLDMFEEAGVEVPGPDWTWDDYLEIARKLTRDRDGDGNIDVWGSALPPWELAIWSFGGDSVDDPKNPTRCTFDDPKVIEAIQWIADMRLKHGATIREAVQTAQIDPFQSGQVAITWNGHWAVPEYIARANFKWDVAMPPIGPAGRAIANFGSCFSIPAEAKHPEQAWKVIEFICGGEGARMFAMKNIMTPVFLEVANSPEFHNLNPPDHQKYFIDALDFGRLRPETSAYQELVSMINMELEHVWAGEAGVEEVCRRIATKGTRILNEAR
ncbi:MAG TPA: sugar ABC transporter substrate-binding protein [Candidatus Sumerlaeota bacterium]|nr:sugar ABC transporter substrate-binding protein [Candidatus Sumerlaeota bacterium]